MIKQQLYKSTKRINNNSVTYYLTEKLDGSNMVIFNHDGVNYIAQRKSIYTFEEILNADKAQIKKLYKGLYGWLAENHATIKLHPGSGVIGEWLGDGHIKYTLKANEARFLVFAKLTVTQNEDLTFNTDNINYNHDLIKYAFGTEKLMPECMDLVPLLKVQNKPFSIEELDEFYDAYVSEVNRKVEGFVIVNNNIPQKYVRFKDGMKSKHIIK